MSHTTAAPLYAIIMLMTGIGIPVMAVLNADFGNRIGSPAAASVVLFGVALATAAGATLLSGIPARSAFAGVPTADYLAGLAVAFYVLAVTYIAPRFGLGNAVFFVLFGQIATATVIDHFGLFGAVRSEVTAPRLIGIALMVAGVFLARKPV